MTFLAKHGGWMSALLITFIVVAFSMYMLRLWQRDTGHAVSMPVPAQEPTTLYLTVVDERSVPQVCQFAIATQVQRDDNLHVVVDRASCPALERKELSN